MKVGRHTDLTVTITAASALVFGKIVFPHESLLAATLPSRGRFLIRLIGGICFSSFDEKSPVSVQSSTRRQPGAGAAPGSNRNVPISRCDGVPGVPADERVAGVPRDRGGTAWAGTACHRIATGWSSPG